MSYKSLIWTLSDFHKNRVRYNSNTTNKATSKNIII